MYKIQLSKQAKKFIEKQDHPTRKRLFQAILEIGENPIKISNVKKLKGENLARKRVGDFRIVYEVVDEQLLIYILKVDNRGQIYKKR